MSGELLLALKKVLDDMFDYMTTAGLGSEKFEAYVDSTCQSVQSVIDLYMRNNTELIKNMNSAYRETQDEREHNALGLVYAVADQCGLNLKAPSKKSL